MARSRGVSRAGAVYPVRRRRKRSLPAWASRRRGIVAEAGARRDSLYAVSASRAHHGGEPPIACRFCASLSRLLPGSTRSGQLAVETSGAGNPFSWARLLLLQLAHVTARKVAPERIQVGHEFRPTSNLSSIWTGNSCGQKVARARRSARSFLEDEPRSIAICDRCNSDSALD